MAGITDTQSLRFGQVTDPISFTMQKNLADDIARELDAVDAAKQVGLGRPVARMSRNATQSLAVNTLVTINFDTEVFDTHNMINLGTNAQRVTVSSEAGVGMYFVTARASADTTGWTRGDLQITRNGGVYYQRTQWSPQGNNNTGGMMYLPNVGDFIDVRMIHQGGGTTNIQNVNLYVWKLSN